MAPVAVERAMNLADQQGIHPFFAKPHDAPGSLPADTVAQDENQPNVGGTPKRSQSKGRPLATRGRKPKRKSDESDSASKVKQASIAAFAGLKQEEGRPEAVNEATSLDEDPNLDRRKRQRTTSPVAGRAACDPAEESPAKAEQSGNDAGYTDQSSWIEQLECEAKKPPVAVAVEASSPTAPAQVIDSEGVDAVPETSPMPVADSAERKRTPLPPSSPPLLPSSPANPLASPRGNATHGLSSPPKPSPPRKMLRVNARGRFSSPVSNAPKEDVHAAGKQRKTRSRASKKATRELVVKISYSKDDERVVQMAEDIDKILAGTQRVPAPTVSSVQIPAVLPKSAKPAGPPKPTHPFFTGKAQRKDAEGAESDQSVPTKSSTLAEKIPSKRETAITPGKLRAQARAEHRSADGGDFSMFGAAAKPRRVLGGPDAPWPWKGVARISDEDSHGTAMELSSIPSISSLLEERRKLKGMVYKIPDCEAIIPLAADVPHVSGKRIEDSSAARSDVVRFPQRLLTTGPDIQRRIHSEMSSSQRNLSGLGAERAGQRQVDGKSPHPALLDLSETIPDELTPFDHGRCETVSWAQKYAPKRAANVLGSSTEVTLLRRWLEALKVNSVEGALKDLGARSKKGGSTKPPKKRRKKDELDDFIVNDEEGLGDLDELSDPDEAPGAHAGLPPRRSMVRSGGDVSALGEGRKLHNLLLLSGPHGCGKTATVYAVANELGFEVFEINPGSRRSGKDVLEKIGDMTENHLVQRRAQEQPDATAVDSDTERLTDAVQKDIQSGRQKSTSSFFQPMAQKQPKPKHLPKKATAAPAVHEKAQPSLSRPKQSQKQSLILLEEVDVLFEDDKNFWQTVEHLALHSKRPVIMTCTDENLFGINQDFLHALLRISPPPTDLATDYLLLLAAKEGHLLSRQAVASLYESKGHDLRATIMELDFWCQMAVGDRKGGLEWMYQRWPPGNDVDEHGKTLRVASKDTYRTGMGWIERDVLLDESHIGFDREYELMLEMVESWSIEPETFSSVTVSDHRMDMYQPHGDVNLRALQEMDRLVDFSSAADVYCRVGVPTRQKAALDPTQPSLPEKARSNYISGYNFLQADALEDFTKLDTHLAVSSHLAARRCILASATLSLAAPTALDEDSIDRTILDHTISRRQPPQSLTRADFFCFDPLAEPPSSAFAATAGGSGGALGGAAGSMTASSFDRTFRLLVEELAPFVRSIAAHDLQLERERVRISGLLSAGGKPPKRHRTTRAARSALEGGRRETARREWWFFDRQALNLAAVMRTGGKEWAGLGSGAAAAAADEMASVSARSRDGEGDGDNGDGDVEMAL